MEIWTQNGGCDVTQALITLPMHVLTWVIVTLGISAAMHFVSLMLKIFPLTLRRQSNLKLADTSLLDCMMILQYNMCLKFDVYLSLK